MVLLSGVGVAGYHPEGSKLAHFVSEDDKAGTAMAIFSVWGNLGHGLGPILAVAVLSFSGLGSVHYIMIPGLLALPGIVLALILPDIRAGNSAAGPEQALPRQS